MRRVLVLVAVVAVVSLTAARTAGERPVAVVGRSATAPDTTRAPVPPSTLTSARAAPATKVVPTTVVAARVSTVATTAPRGGVTIVNSGSQSVNTGNNTVVGPGSATVTNGPATAVGNSSQVVVSGR